MMGKAWRGFLWRSNEGGKKAVTFLKKSNQKTFAKLDRDGFTATGLGLVEIQDSHAGLVVIQALDGSIRTD
jgi:hypothetical protein